MPVLTGEQRRRASARAVAAKKRRARIRRDLKAGRLRLPEVLAAVDAGDRALARMRVRDLLLALPRVGPTTAYLVMDEVGIAESRRLAGLSTRQRAELLRRFG
ncbi:integration host factor, actinobacterial type [Actinomyces sp. 594]|uniref:integration host factor, actinobacterial type n=1 Tax=Actinomyces sp. 594 TaxID=2057793 RepID=UPI00280B2EBC|nr:integration host factor, actinobacterial type [Actinomyces sp. 594]